MAYEYLEHEADIGIRARGSDLADALAEAARAVGAVMVEPEGVKSELEYHATAHAPARDLLVVEFLNEVLSVLWLRNMALAEVGPVEVTGKEGDWHARVALRGERIDQDRHLLGTEVKAATYSGLQVTEEPGKVTVQCVLDI